VSELLIHGPLTGQSQTVEKILRALPDWFGIESEVQNYVREAAELPAFIAEVDGEASGFLIIKKHNPQAAEVYVMGVLPKVHRHGLGRRLMHAAETWLRGEGVQYLQVKTLADTHPDAGYALTRAFYHRTGFTPLEVLESVWGPENPCLLMVKKL
jgi:GNAT superfamily N-acetyltransferase